MQNIHNDLIVIFPSTSLLTSSSILASRRGGPAVVLKLSMKSAKYLEQNAKGRFGSSKGATTNTDPLATEFWGKEFCEEFLSLVLVPLLDCLKKKLCAASPELKREILAQIQVHEWRTNSKADLLLQLKELKDELAFLGEAKVTDSPLKRSTWAAPEKLPTMCGAPVRLSKL